MTLRLITTSIEQVGPGQYQPMYRTFDCRLPADLDLSKRTVVGFEIINDTVETIEAVEEEVD